MKVEIIIKEGNYHKSHKDGAKFTSVDFRGRTYGGGYPCDNPEEVKKAIKEIKEKIEEEGDIPVIVDKRETAKLSRWFK